MSTRSTLKHLSASECAGLLAAGRFGRLAVVLDGEPMIFPVNYLYEGGVIVFRTNRGSKLSGADHARVAFEIDGVHPDGRSGWSVVVRGRAYEITEAFGRSAEHVKTLPIPSALRGPAEPVVEIIPESVTGREIGVYPNAEAFAPLDPVWVGWPRRWVEPAR
jgi:nitroimidazol reductase NimA-like FMN-containing flavoprotein (pyridoxamine 5'-phosphate oxidase superfamily)